MAGYHETYNIQPDQGTENLGSAFCAFKGKKMTTTSSGWDVHEGTLLQKHFGERKIYAKVKRGLLRNECKAEVEGLKVVQNVLDQLEEVGSSVRVVPTFYTEVETLGKLYKLTTNKHEQNVVKGGFVLIQDRLRGAVEELWSFEGKPEKRKDRSHPLAKLSIESHRLSFGETVIAGVEGVAGEDYSKKNTGHPSALTYYITSVNVYSKTRTFGPKDRGTEGLAAFQRWVSHQEISQGIRIDSNEVAVDANALRDFESDSNSVTNHDSHRLEPTAPPMENAEEDLPPPYEKVLQMNSQNIQMLEQFFRGGPLPVSEEGRRYVYNCGNQGIE